MDMTSCTPGYKLLVGLIFVCLFTNFVSGTKEGLGRYCSMKGYLEYLFGFVLQDGSKP